MNEVDCKMNDSGSRRPRSVKHGQVIASYCLQGVGKESGSFAKFYNAEDELFSLQDTISLIDQMIPN